MENFIAPKSILSEVFLNMTNTLIWQPTHITIIGKRETVTFKAPIIVDGLMAWLVQGNMEGLIYLY